MTTIRRIATALAATAMVAVLSGQEPDQAAELYARYLAAVNAHDVDRPMAFFAAVAVIVRNGRPQPQDLTVERGYREFEAAARSIFRGRVVAANRIPWT
jgi:ketosteroid isomerase-like protein